MKDRTASKGQVPGSLILIGEQKMDHPVIRLIEYDAEELVEKELKSIDEAIPCIESEKVSWINIYGLHDLQLIERMGEIFGLHPLFMEDFMNTDQRPGYADGDTYNALIVKMLRYDEETRNIHSEQFTLVLGSHYVLTLQEQPGDVFNPVRERIRLKKRRIRLNDNDYLAYALLDTIVDNYMIVIESIGRQVEEMEGKLFGRQDKKVVEEIYRLKTELSFLRKSVRPVKEIMFQVMKSDRSFFRDKHRSYLQDLNDLVTQATDAIELYSGMISDHLNIYSTNVSNRINSVMKVLTIFASIFIPLTFIAGIYGMNFRYMPELEFRYGYLVFWIVVVGIVIGLLIYFRRKGWL